MDPTETAGVDRTEQAVADAPATADPMQPSARADTTQQTATSDTTEQPAMADMTEQPTAADTTQQTATSDTTEQPAMADMTEQPTAADTTQQTATSDTTAPMATADTAEPPTMADTAEPPAMADTTEQTARDAPTAEAAAIPDVQPPRETAARQRTDATQAPLPRREHPRTKLVCTIGPATADRIRELVDAGMDIARINFSHGSPESHKQAVDAVRSAAHHARRSVAIMVDLPGRKIRLGELEGDEVELQTGHTFLLRRSGGAEGAGTERAADVSHDGLAELLQPGDRVLLADGAAELRVAAIASGGAGVETEVVRGGTIRSRSGVNVPSERLAGPALTEQDHEAVPRALALRADLIAQSFIRTAADVAELRALLPAEHAPPIVAKIETRAGVENFADIAAVCDGVMVARGDLGVDIPFEDVPLIQKDLLTRGREMGRFTIVATQMLESMTTSARPTRAEVSDVANAVLDGADAVMLSAETAVGTYPLEATRAMVSICMATERDGSAQLRALPRKSGPPTDNPAAIAHAAVMLADSYPAAAAIWCFTRTGRTAEMLSALRPQLPIVAFTASPVVARRLAVRHAVVPVVISASRTGEPLIRRMQAAARSQRVIEAGQSATVVLVTTSDQADGVNRLEVHQV